MKQESKLTPKGAKIVASLGRFRDAIEAGTPIERSYTVRRKSRHPQTRRSEQSTSASTLGASRRSKADRIGTGVVFARSIDVRR
jgi:hypothetical protein